MMAQQIKVFVTEAWWPEFGPRIHMVEGKTESYPLTAVPPE